MKHHPGLQTNELKEDAPVLNDNFYLSDEYSQIISHTNKHNPRWIYSSLSLTGQRHEDENEVDVVNSFVASSTSPSHPYLADIRQAIASFKEWRQWNVNNNNNNNNNNNDNSGDDNNNNNNNNNNNTKAWKLSQSIKKKDSNIDNPDDDRMDSILRIYTCAHAPTVSRSQLILPYSVPIIAGIFCNNEHYSAIDESILSSKMVQQCDDYSYKVYVKCNKPFPFSSNRDLLMIRFCYILDNAEFIFGETSVVDDSFIPDNVENNIIRAQNVNIIHVKPADNNKQHSVVTHYCSYQPNGGFGGFSKYFQQRIFLDKAKYLTKLDSYMNEIRKILPTEGQLFIPLRLLDSLDIDHDAMPSHMRIGERIDSSESVDDHIVDVNLAVQTVMCDLKQFFNGIAAK